MNERIINIIKNFHIAGNITSVKTFGNGHINKTVLVNTDEDEYILQQINSVAFPDVNMLMNNIDIVTSFIKSQELETLEVIKTNDGKLYYAEGKQYFRMYKYIQNTICYETIGDNLSLAANVGRAYGNLHKLLSHIDPSLIGEVIPNFHNTPKRYNDFYNSYLKASDKKKELAKEEIDFIISHQDTYSKIVDGIKDGSIKNHIIHNDTKINNILFDKNSGDIRCVIDLDTIMPGSVLYDIGDSFRGIYSGENEDNEDTSLLKVNLPIFKVLTKAYLLEMKDELTNKEIELIPYSIYLMTIECGMRFLADYFDGNIYFNIVYQTHNLVRCRSQIALAKDVLFNLENMNNIIKEIMEEIR